MDKTQTADAADAATPVDKQRTNDFDLVAPIYDALATLSFAGSIHRAQVALLPEVADIDTALIIGGGTGWFLLELLRRTKVRRVTYLELSPKMLRKSKALVEKANPEWLSRVEFREGTQDSLTTADGPYDLIVTNFFLDLFSDEKCAYVAEGLSRRLAATGRWLFVDFVTPERGPARWVALPVFKAMFTFFNVVSRMESLMPPDYEGALTRLGLRKIVEKNFHFTMIRAWILQRA